MKSHEELMLLSDEEKRAYHASEAEKVISSAPANKQLALRAFQAKILSSNRRYKNPLAAASAAFNSMLVLGLYKLDDALQELKGKTKKEKDK